MVDDVIANGILGRIASLRTFVVFFEGNFGVFYAGKGGIVGRLGKLVIGGTVSFVDDDANKANSNNAKQQCGNNHNVN